MIKNLFSTSDFRHPVVTPAFYFMCNLFTRCRLQSIRYSWRSPSSRLQQFSYPWIHRYRCDSPKSIIPYLPLEVI